MGWPVKTRQLGADPLDYKNSAPPQINPIFSIDLAALYLPIFLLSFQEHFCGRTKDFGDLQGFTTSQINTMEALAAVLLGLGGLIFLIGFACLVNIAVKRKEPNLPY